MKRWLVALLLPQLPPRLDLRRQDLRPIDSMAQLQAPVLFAAGANDLSTRWPETERLFAAAREPKAFWPVPEAGHVDLYDFNPKAYQARLGPWLREHLRKPLG